MSIAVLGAGAFGTALALSLAREGHEICIWARDAATVDAINSDRVYSKGKSSLESLRILLEAVNSHFDEEIVGCFIRMVGIYPPGEIVELTNGEVGIIIGCPPPCCCSSSWPGSLAAAGSCCLGPTGMWSCPANTRWPKA